MKSWSDKLHGGEAVYKACGTEFVAERRRDEGLTYDPGKAEGSSASRKMKRD